MSTMNTTGASANIGILDQIFGVVNAGITGAVTIEQAKINKENTQQALRLAIDNEQSKTQSKDKQALYITGLMLLGLIGFVIAKKKG